jgi:tetratricopeptide (TPR) repeat protein
MDPYEQAGAFIDAVAGRSEEVGNLRCLAVCRYAHGAMATVRGDLETAERSLDVALDLNERIGSPAGVAYTMAELAGTRTAAGDLDGGWEAAVHGLEAAERASIRDHCLQRNQAAGIHNRVAAGDLERAASLVEAAVALDDEAGPCFICRPDLYTAIASYHLARRRLDEAGAWVERALSLAEAGGNRPAVATALAVRGRIEAARGEVGAARVSLERAAGEFRDLGHPLELSRTVEVLAALPTG